MYLLLGLATFLHLLTGLDAAILLSTAVLVKHKAKSFHYFLKATPFYFIPALFSLVPLALIEFSQKSAGPEVIMAYAWIRIPWHILPSQFSIWSYLSFSMLLILFFLSWRYVPARTSKDALLVMLCAVFFFVIGTVFTEIFPSEFVVKIEFFRMIILFRVIMLVYIAQYFRAKLKKPELFTAIAIASLFDHILLIIIPLYLSWQWAKDRLGVSPEQPEHLISVLFAVVSAGLLIAIPYLALSQALQIRIIEALLWMIIVVAFYWMLFITLPSTLNKAKILPVLIIVLLSLTAFQQTYALASAEPAKDALYAWIQKNTPEDAVFLIPPTMEDFRMKAERAIVVDFKALPFKSDQMLEWKNRIGDVTNNIVIPSRAGRQQILRQGYMTLTEKDILKLKEKYGFAYILVEKPQALQFTKLFENQKYVVYLAD